MNIGQAAAFSGVSAKMIRYYEKTGLIPHATRSEAGYRNYTVQDAYSLRFIRRSRDLGWTVKQIAELLPLWRDRERPSGDIKTAALFYVADLERKITVLQALVHTLHALANSCHGNNRPDCPIIEGLADFGMETLASSGMCRTTKSSS
ncbi:HTH-type transcriptional regulator HmrR [compost metagenome]